MSRESRRIRRLASGAQAAADRRLVRALEACGHVCPECGQPLTWSIESREAHAARLLVGKVSRCSNDIEA